MTEQDYVNIFARLPSKLSDPAPSVEFFQDEEGNRTALLEVMNVTVEIKGTVQNSYQYFYDEILMMMLTKAVGCMSLNPTKEIVADIVYRLETMDETSEELGPQIELLLEDIKSGTL